MKLLRCTRCGRRPKIKSSRKDPLASWVKCRCGRSIEHYGFASLLIVADDWNQWNKTNPKPAPKGIANLGRQDTLTKGQDDE